jgi:hypothetical protein
MYEHEQRRAIMKKRKSTIDADSKKGRNKRPMNICQEVKAPPHEEAPGPTDDKVPLKIHSPLEERGSLRKSVNYRKQDHSMIHSHAMMWRRKCTILIFGPFFHADWYNSVYQSKKKPIVNM